MTRVVALFCVSFVFLDLSPQKPPEKPGAMVPALVQTGPNGKTRKPVGVNIWLFEESMGGGEGKAVWGQVRGGANFKHSSTPLG